MQALGKPCMYLNYSLHLLLNFNADIYSLQNEFKALFLCVETQFRARFKGNAFSRKSDYRHAKLMHKIL